FPYIVIQFLVILVVIFFPELVMHYKTDHPTVDPGSVHIEIPGFGGQGNTDLGLPPLGGLDGGSTAPPAFGLPPLNLGGETPAAPETPTAPQRQPDLSQPPSFGQ